jgi:hypothetical protein
VLLPAILLSKTEVGAAGAIAHTTPLELAEALLPKLVLAVYTLAKYAVPVVRPVIDMPLVLLVDPDACCVPDTEPTFIV